METHTTREIATAILARAEQSGQTLDQLLAAPVWPQITRQECRGTGGDKDLARVVQFALAHLPGVQS